MNSRLKHGSAPALPEGTPARSGTMYVPVEWTATTRSGRTAFLTRCPQGDNGVHVLPAVPASRTYTLVLRKRLSRRRKHPLRYRVDVVPDLYPTILVEQKTDALPGTALFQRRCHG